MCPIHFETCNQMPSLGKSKWFHIDTQVTDRDALSMAWPCLFIPCLPVLCLGLSGTFLLEGWSWKKRGWWWQGRPGAAALPSGHSSQGAQWPNSAGLAEPRRGQKADSLSVLKQQRRKGKNSVDVMQWPAKGCGPQDSDSEPYPRA